MLELARAKPLKPTKQAKDLSSNSLCASRVFRSERAFCSAEVMKDICANAYIVAFFHCCLHSASTLSVRSGNKLGMNSPNFADKGKSCAKVTMFALFHSKSQDRSKHMRVNQ
jgi:hypothetical protein